MAIIKTAGRQHPQYKELKGQVLDTLPLTDELATHIASQHLVVLRAWEITKALQGGKRVSTGEYRYQAS